MAYRRCWQRDFDRSIRENPNWPVVVSQGDSWFSYPHEKNVVDFLDEPLSGRDAPNKKGKDASQRDWSLLRLERMQDEILGVMTGGPGDRGGDPGHRRRGSCASAQSRDGGERRRASFRGRDRGERDACPRPLPQLHGL